MRALNRKQWFLEQRVPTSKGVVKVLLLVTVLALITSTVTNAAVFVTYPASFTSIPQAPPLVLLSSSASGVNVSLNPNGTYANVTVKANTAYVEVTKNGGFDTSPNGWLYGYTIYSGYAIVEGVWNQTFSFAPGASGVILLYMRLYDSSGFFSYVNGSVYLVQNVTLPRTPLSSVVLNVTYYSAYLGNLATLRSYYLFAELMDTNGTVVWSGELSVVGSTGSWNNATFTIPVTSVVPGYTYTLLVGARVAGTTINVFGITGNLTVYQLFDSVRLYVKSQYPSFSGSILNINVTKGSYAVSLSVVSLNVLGSANVNASILIANLSGGATTPITVSNGLLVTRTTSELPLTTPPQGYTSGHIQLSASIYPSSVVNIPLKITYGVGGVSVTYLINITIVDPPVSNVTSNGARNTVQCAHTCGAKHELIRELKHLDELLLGHVLGSKLVLLERWRG